jgi:phosphotransferase system HPr (HPr) family protein
MKTTRVTIRWPQGLHMRAAARLVKLSRSFRCQIQLRLGHRLADARSILSLMVLCAGLGACLDIEAAGNDEHEALRAVEEFFAAPDGEDDGADKEEASGV